MAIAFCDTFAKRDELRNLRLCWILSHPVDVVLVPMSFSALPFLEIKSGLVAMLVSPSHYTERGAPEYEISSSATNKKQ